MKCYTIRSVTRARPIRNLKNALLALALVACSPPGQATPPIGLTPLAHDATPIALSSLKGTAHIVMFWRTDCAPCLIELEHFTALRAAAGGARIVLVALEDASTARSTMDRFDIPADDGFTPSQSAERTLEAVSNGGRRLPYAIALNPRGEICQRHVGLIGTDRIRDWVRTCSG